MLERKFFSMRKMSFLLYIAWDSMCALYKEPLCHRTHVESSLRSKASLPAPWDRHRSRRAQIAHWTKTGLRYSASTVWCQKRNIVCVLSATAPLWSAACHWALADSSSCWRAHSPPAYLGTRSPAGRSRTWSWFRASRCPPRSRPGTRCGLSLGSCARGSWC